MLCSLNLSCPQIKILYWYAECKYKNIFKSYLSPILFASLLIVTILLWSADYRYVKNLNFICFVRAEIPSLQYKLIE